MKKVGIAAIVFTSLMVHSQVASAQTLIVGNKQEHTVSFIDMKSGQEVVRTQSGKAPHEVAVSPDGKIAAIVAYREQSFTGNEIHVFDIETGKPKGVIDLGDNKAPHGLKWIPGTNNVIATTEASNSVVLVDVVEMKMLKSIGTGQRGSHMVALTPDNDLALVANINAGSFTVIDLEKFEKIKDIKAGEGTEAIAVSPDGTQVWVGNNRSKSIMVFDREKLEVLNEIKTEGIPIRVEISPDGKFVAVSEPDLSRVSIYDATTLEPRANIDLSEVEAKVPVTLLFSPDGDHLWAAATGSAKVVEIKTSDWKISRILKAGEGADGLGYSEISISK